MHRHTHTHNTQDLYRHRGWMSVCFSGSLYPSISLFLFKPPCIFVFIINFFSTFAKHKIVFPERCHNS